MSGPWWRRARSPSASPRWVIPSPSCGGGGAVDAWGLRRAAAINSRQRLPSSSRPTEEPQLDRGARGGWHLDLVCLRRHPGKRGQAERAQGFDRRRADGGSAAGAGVDAPCRMRTARWHRSRSSRILNTTPTTPWSWESACER